MKTGTTANWTFGTAEIAKLERQPYYKVNVDWPTGTANDDISGDVLSLAGRSELDAVINERIPSGAVSGDLDVELKSGSKYSSFNASSDLYGSQRLNCDAAAYAGFTSDGTAQYLQQFSGLTNSLEVKSSERKTFLKCVDKSDLLKRRQIQLYLCGLSFKLLDNFTSKFYLIILIKQEGKRLSLVILRSQKGWEPPH